MCEKSLLLLLKTFGASFTKKNSILIICQIIWLAAAQLNANSQSLDGFNANIGAENTGNIVQAVAIQPDGKIIIAGTFSNVGGVARKNIARLHPDGTLDQTFNSNVSNTYIYDIALQSNGKIIVAGNFLVSPAGQPGIFRLNIDGTLDTTFNPAYNSTDASGIPFNFDNLFTCVAIDANGKILVGGYFNFYVNGATKYGFARLNSDGTVDSSFDSLVNSSVQSITIQPDNKILIGGSFRVSGEQMNRNIIRLNGNGTLDLTFVSPLIEMPNQYRYIQKIVIQPDGKILVGGTLAIFASQTTYSAILLRLQNNGAVDTSFNSKVNNFANGSVKNIAFQPNSKILIGGNFEYQDGSHLRKGLQRIRTDGTTDTSFNPNPNNNINDFAVQSDGKMLAAGNFTTIGGQSINYLARFAADSTSAKRPNFDFDGDGKSDIAVFRPSNGSWYVQQSVEDFTGSAFGISTDKLAPADYDGDGKTDVAVYRAGNWYLNRSSAGFSATIFGDGNDIPVPADYDGDGKADIAVFRPSNGTWYRLNSSNGAFVFDIFGLRTDKPVPGDYNGDGKVEIAVFRPSNGYWYLSTDPETGYGGILFGSADDIPVPADYDGDGKTDVAVFRPSNGSWYLNRSQAGFAGTSFGAETDLPVPADYDGDGKVDLAVVRNGNWYLNRTTQGFAGIQFGTSTDKPIPNTFIR